MLSGLAGLVRQRVLGHYLGISAAADAYAAAIRIPNFLQNLLGKGVLSASFNAFCIGVVLAPFGVTYLAATRALGVAEASEVLRRARLLRR